tara:strand:- start:127 stop:639 length:513 start_codon:yes stop_codon:yes gene_type:complete
MSYIVVVDVGIKNLGLLVYDSNSKRVCLWERVDITEGTKYVPSNNVHYIHSLIDKHAQYFASAHLVIVERQMRVNMRIIEAIFQSRFADKCKVINAQSVKMHFSISMRNYKQNKKKAVEWLDCHWNTVLSKFVSNQSEILPLWVAESKKDDLADSMIMMLYYLNTYSEIV